MLMAAASAVNRVVAAWSCRTSDGGVRLPSDSAGVQYSAVEKTVCTRAPAVD